MKSAQNALQMGQFKSSEPPAPNQDPAQELSLAQAADTFTVSQATLRRLISAGRLPARSVSGVRGREWRVTADALEQAGYVRRAPAMRASPEAAEIRRLSEALAVERARNSQLDSDLGYAMLTIGRLREAGIDPDELFGGGAS